jgi:hypothetical protein
MSSENRNYIEFVSLMIKPYIFMNIKMKTKNEADPKGSVIHKRAHEHRRAKLAISRTRQSFHIQPFIWHQKKFK